VEEGKKREETGAYFADEATARTLTLLMRRIGVEEAVAPGCSRGRRPAAPRAGVDLLLLDLLLLGRVSTCCSSTCCSSGGCRPAAPRPAAPRAGVDLLLLGRVSTARGGADRDEIGEKERGEI
jgi:hypothetical protein